MELSTPRLSDAEIEQILEDTGAVRHGHFRLTSGRHSATYVRCARVMESPETTVALAAEAVARIPSEIRSSIELVVSPAIGERKDGAMCVRRSFEVPEGANVLVAEDVVTTGGSVKEVCDLVEAAGGIVVGVVSIVDRKTARAFDQPLWPLLSFEVPSWEPSECPLCASDVEIEAPGSRALAK